MCQECTCRNTWNRLVQWACSTQTPGSRKRLWKKWLVTNTLCLGGGILLSTFLHAQFSKTSLRGALQTPLDEEMDKEGQKPHECLLMRGHRQETTPQLFMAPPSFLDQGHVSSTCYSESIKANGVLSSEVLKWWHTKKRQEREPGWQINILSHPLLLYPLLLPADRCHQLLLDWGQRPSYWSPSFYTSFNIVFFFFTQKLVVLFLTKFR